VCVCVWREIIENGGRSGTRVALEEGADEARGNRIRVGLKVRVCGC
jgi:hypothetical protein